MVTAIACAGWSIADVVLHLAQTNELAVASFSGDLAQQAAAGGWVGVGADVDGAASDAVALQRGASPDDLLARWRRSAAALVQAATACEPSARVEWVAGTMAPASLATTRIAETWIHAGDIADGLGTTVEPTARLWHIARLAHRTLPYAFARAGQELPGAVRFVLDPPGGGEPWTFGESRAPTEVQGPALDLCRVAGQRASARQTSLRATGPAAEGVLALVRTFA